MLRVGLTGGIGSGKSTVSALLASLGAVVVDADAVAREVVEPGTPALAAVADRFGAEVLGADGGLDRPALGRVVFGNPTALRDLEALTHPAIWARTAQLVRDAGPDAVVVHDMPQHDNRVELDEKVTDAWGLPAVRITYSQHPDDVATQAWIRQRQMEILEAMGAKKTWGDQPGGFYTSRHLMGTCRMGKDPAKSVVDSYGRAHDVANLFIVDGSNFVTSARQQPTATIQALAYRAADNMVRMARRGEL